MFFCRNNQSAKAVSLVTAVTSGTPPSEVHPILFDGIGEFIHSTILKMNGAAGPSGLDTASWKRLCTLFITASVKLCDSIAALAKQIIL